MWGARRRRGEEEEAVAMDFQESQIRATVMQDGSTGKKLKPVQQYNNNNGFDISTFIDAYISMIEKMVASPDFETMVTPDYLKSFVSNIPGLESNTEILALLDSPQFQDPVLLKETITQGVSQLREYSGSIVEMMNDPMQVQALLSQLPPSVGSAVEGLLTG